MGMALRKLEGRNQLGVRNIRAQRETASMYVGAFEIRPRTAELPPLDLWGLMGRWISLPRSVRKALSAVLVLAFIGAFYAVANIQLEAAKEKIEMARSSQSQLEDKLAEIKSFSNSGVNSHFDFAGNGWK